MSDLAKHFPKLTNENHQETSPATVSYNCIAWAAQDSERWWWPDRYGLYYWPPAVQRAENLDAFVRAYAELGYEVCQEETPEENVDKIAIFVDASGTPTHVARQLPNGRWTSKCGKLEDIEHDLEALTGNCYGEVAIRMKRKRGVTQVAA